MGVGFFLISSTRLIYLRNKLNIGGWSNKVYFEKTIPSKLKLLETFLFLRESGNFFMRNAGAIIGVPSSFVNHAENGRLDLNTTIILKFLKAYGYRLEEFESMKKGRIVLPEHTLLECIEILKRLELSKLKAVKTILQSF